MSRTKPTVRGSRTDNQGHDGKNPNNPAAKFTSKDEEQDESVMDQMILMVCECRLEEISGDQVGVGDLSYFYMFGKSSRVVD